MSNERQKVVKGDVAESLHIRFKILCAKNNRTMSEVLAEIVEEWVIKQEDADKKKT
jgi:hypothetical protein